MQNGKVKFLEGRRASSHKFRSEGVKEPTAFDPLYKAMPPGQPIGVTVHCTQHPIREQSLSSQPNEAPKPRLPDSIDHPITVMPPSRMQNTTLAMPLVEDLSRYGIEDCSSVQKPKKATPILVFKSSWYLDALTKWDKEKKGKGGKKCCDYSAKIINFDNSNSVAQQPMGAGAYYAHTSILDHWALRFMSRCADQVVSLKRDPQCLSPRASLVLIYRPTALGMKD
ncbi:UNVERIFIED_CONTAM: hypothetical protein NCL1_58484 [Trichonephila clavipes]